MSIFDNPLNDLYGKEMADSMARDHPEPTGPTESGGEIALFKDARAEILQLLEDVGKLRVELNESWAKEFKTAQERDRLKAGERAALDLLAVMHCDGGHHTADVGFIRSCEDAQEVRHAMVVELDRLQAELEEREKRLARIIEEAEPFAGGVGNGPTFAAIVRAARGEPTEGTGGKRTP